MENEDLNVSEEELQYDMHNTKAYDEALVDAQEAESQEDQ